MASGGGDSLSAQQRKCLLLVGEGLTTKEIAHEIGLSARTVDEHIEKGRAKLNAPNRQRAAAMLRRAAERDNDASQPDPYPIRGEILTVTADDDLAPSSSATLRLRDGDKVQFGHFPIAEELEFPASRGENDNVSVDRLKVLLKILIIAASSALILLAMPSLIDGAEVIASSILNTVHSN